MFDSIKRFWLVLALLLAGGRSMFGFALLGPPNEAYQVPTIGYMLGGDIGTPKNYGQGYRWNTPTNFYAYSEAFERYFGSNGEVQVDAAFDMFNSLSNVSQLNLDSYPLRSSRVNYRAQQLSLVDLKSFTMSMIIEQLGLAEPDRWTWCLHDRYLPPGAACPAYYYLIIQRNFDPYTGLYSSYVNGVFYDYEIIEICPAAPNPQADAYETIVDPLQAVDSYGAVAAYGSTTPGTYYLGFTRDDIGGLKSLYSATNAYAETAESNSVAVVTNSQPILLVTSNLAIFAQQALTNDAPTLQTLYPGLVILSTTNSWTNVVTTNVTAYLTNAPYGPDNLIILVLATNFTTNVQTLYYHTFANLQIVHAYSQGFVTKQTVTVGPAPYGPDNLLFTNVQTTTTVQNFTNGDFYILPTNQCGPYAIISTQFVNVVSVTNNIPLATNFVTITNGATFPVSLSFINYFTNYYLIAYPVDCVTNTGAVREGMEHITFQRVGYDYLRNQLVTPITNYYHLTAISNGAPVVQTFRRIITQPDILIDGADLANPGGNGAIPAVYYSTRSVPLWSTNLVPPGNPGPGTMQPTGRVFTYDTVGPIWINYGPYVVQGVTYFFQTNSVFDFVWGSFDGTTNEPVVYPDTQSTANMEAQLFFQITTGPLPSASISANGPGNAYNFQLTTQGGSYSVYQPLQWTLAPNSPGLPTGLSLSSGGLISGSPTTVGTFDFIVQVTDGNGAVVQKQMTITVTY